MKHLNIFWFLIFGFVFTQNLPDIRKTNWTECNNNYTFNYPSVTYDFLQNGGNNSGLVSNNVALNVLLNSIGSNGAIIYFPAGEYLFTSTINLKSNIVFRGENSSNTIFNFNLQGANDLITIKGNQTNIESNFSSSSFKDSNNIQVENSSAFLVNDYIRIIDNDLDKITSTWAESSTGQIAKIQSINGNTITLKSILRRDYLLTNTPKIVKINTINNVGIENITINRIDATTTQTSNIRIAYASNCNINCIKSFNCNFSHIELNYSTNCKIEGSYFQDAFAYGGNGQGYGVVLQFATGECLVYNNIFKHLRHSILFQAGSNGNIASYNYSRDPYWTESISNAAGDLVLHGNYPYLNLIEGNIMQNIVIDNSHGINGPYNTFLRNRGELYGIFMNSGAGNSQNFISNEVTNTGFLLGLYVITGTDHFEYGNNIKGTIYASGTTATTANSFYLTNTPDFYNLNSVFPPIGTISNYNTYINESKTRYNSNTLTQCSSISLSIDEVVNNELQIMLFPNPTSNLITLFPVEENYEIKIVNAEGKLTNASIITRENKLCEISVKTLVKGVYYAIISDSKTTFKSIKFIKK